MRDRVRAFATTPGRLLVVSDFDGTLAPIVPDPMGAQIEPGARVALRRLARVAAARPERLSIAVLSGRSARDVAARVRVGGIRYLGNHGFEEGLLRRGDPAERLLARPVSAIDGDPKRARAIAERVAERLSRPAWLFVEDKGPAVAFHYRQAPDPATARAAILDALDEGGGEAPVGGEAPMERLEAPMERLEGRQIVELQPPGAGGKGAALERIVAMDRPAAVLALGDDVSDAEAFRALARARASGTVDGLVIAVHGAAETPLAVVEAADLLVAAPRDAARALAEVARALSAETGPR